MRVLVEQTVEQARQWIAALKLPVGVATLMGGEMEEEWEIRPERPHIIVGTQDMLFSRALNRGYAMSRYRWPAHFGLLNNDCLWVCDEVQLMGDGLATSAQLAAFRERFGTFGNCPTIWMSATIDPKMLRTVDMPGDPVEFKLREDFCKGAGRLQHRAGTGAIPRRTAQPGYANHRRGQHSRTGP
jgi:CRISPR-associated endonuclease/helicase Cas3